MDWIVLCSIALHSTALHVTALHSAAQHCSSRRGCRHLGVTPSPPRSRGSCPCCWQGCSSVPFALVQGHSRVHPSWAAQGGCVGAGSSMGPGESWVCLFDTSVRQKKSTPRFIISITNGAELRAFEKCFYNLWLTCGNSCMRGDK